MTDSSGSYSDPLEDALSDGAQRVARLAALLGAAAEVAVRQDWLRRSRPADRAAALAEAQERAMYQEARLRWGPAHDRRWLAEADVLQAARAWSAAAGHAAADPSAAAAVRKCEERLRTLHPSAMAQYDRMRSSGVPGLEAMTAAAPFFARQPHARPGDPAAPRPAVDAGSGLEAMSGITEPEPRAEFARAAAAAEREQAERRGGEIAARLQARARAAGRGDLQSAELAMILEATTLPDEAITRIAAIHSRPWPDRGRPGLLAPAGQSAARLSAQSFPFSAAEVTQASSSRNPAQPPAGRAAGRRNARRPGR